MHKGEIWSENYRLIQYIIDEEQDRCNSIPLEEQKCTTVMEWIKYN